MYFTIGDYKNPQLKNVADFLQKVLNSLVDQQPDPDLVANEKLKEYFSCGYEAANTLRRGFRQAGFIRHRIGFDSRGYPSLTLRFYSTSQREFWREDLSSKRGGHFLEVTFSFFPQNHPEAGKIAMVSRCEQRGQLAA